MPTEAEMKEAFQALDLDNKGTISAKELAAVLKALKGDESYADPIIKVLDKEGDGELSFDEFKAAFIKCKSSSGTVEVGYNQSCSHTF